MITAQNQENKIKPCLALWFILIAALAFLLRLGSYLSPILDIDESMFATYANILLDGGIPYIHSVDTKALFIYYFYAGIFWLFGRSNMVAVHLVTSAWVCLTAYFCYRIGSVIRGQRAGLWAALFYVIFTTTYTPKYIATSMVLIMMFPLAISTSLVLDWERRPRSWKLLLSGIMTTCAMMVKYQAGIQIPLIVAYFVWLRPYYLNVRHRTFLSPLLFYSLGLLIPAFLFWLQLYRLGIVDAYFFWSLGGSMRYIASQMPLTEMLSRAAVRVGLFTLSTLFAWFFSVQSITLGLKGKLFTSKHEKLFLALVSCWLVLSLVPVFMGWRFYAHYFIQLVPALAILSALSFSFLMDSLTLSTRQRRAIYAWLILPTLLFFVVRTCISNIHHIFHDEEMSDYKKTADYIRNHSEVSDSIFVWGFATPIYYFSERKPASRFLWCDWLTGRIPGTRAVRDPSVDTSATITEGSWEMLFEDLDKNRPLYFIDTAPANLHDYGKYPLSLFPNLKEYVENHYFLEKTMDDVRIYRKKGNAS